MTDYGPNVRKTAEGKTIPETLYRGILIPVSSVVSELFTDTMEPGVMRISEDGQKTVNDGNEYGVYMSTKQKVALNYAMGAAGSFDFGYKVNFGKGSYTTVPLPGLGIFYTVATDGLEIRDPKIVEELKGVYNNGYDGDEFIVDSIPSSHFKASKIILSLHSNDSRKKIWDVNEDQQNIPNILDEVKYEYSIYLDKLAALKSELDTLSDKERLDQYRTRKLVWKYFGMGYEL